MKFEVDFKGLQFYYSKSLRYLQFHIECQYNGHIKNKTNPYFSEA